MLRVNTYATFLRAFFYGYRRRISLSSQGRIYAFRRGKAGLLFPAFHELIKTKTGTAHVIELFLPSPWHFLLEAIASVCGCLSSPDIVHLHVKILLAQDH